MRKLIYTAIAALTIVFVACDFETSDNGDLEGYWQVKQLDTLATNNSTDMRTSRWCWSVQAHMLEMRDPQREFYAIFRFEKGPDRLRLWNPIANKKVVSDSIISNPKTLEPIGVIATKNSDNVLEASFIIEKLNSDEMVLSNTLYRFHFRKY